MSPQSAIAAHVLLSRSILLPASSAACALLLLLLFVALLGCATLVGLEPYDGPSDRNAILCSCECDSPIDPTAVPSRNSVTDGPDDAAQPSNQPAAVLNGTTLELGVGNHVGVRFQNVGIPPRAQILSARIQFTSTQGVSANTAFEIRVVDSPNAAPFTTSTNLRALPVVNSPVIWQPGEWKVDEALDNERTPDLKALLQPIVDTAQYTPNSAVAFLITGSGRRVARSFEGSTTKPQAPYLTIEYTPRKTLQDFLACGDPSQAAAICAGPVQSNVSDLANACNVAKACTCTVKTGADTSSFSKVCNDGCPAILPPADCDPERIVRTTAATANHTPVCVATSPLGSVLFGQFSACDLDEGGSQVSVRVVDDGGDSHTRGNHARGRVEFAGTPCPGEPCNVGLAHRVHVGDIVFESGLFGSDHVFTELTGVGESQPGGAAQVDPSGAGAFGPGSAVGSARGHERDGDTTAFFNSNASPLTIGLDGWQPGGACTLQGNLIQTDRVTMTADLHGRLVNQPPTAVAGPDQEVECNEAGRATFSLDASQSHDPDNNVVFFGWFRGSRIGEPVGALPRILLEQDVGSTMPYVFKIADAFGQRDESTTHVSVVDTTPPTIENVTANPNQLWPPNHRLVPVVVSVSVSDICDATPTCRIVSVSSDEPTNGLGDGDTPTDWLVTGDLSVDLRAERSGSGNGRVYSITVECADFSGNTARAIVPVRVPKSRGAG